MSLITTNDERMSDLLLTGWDENNIIYIVLRLRWNEAL